VTNTIAFAQWEMYLRQEDLATSNEHVREFIRQSIPAAGTPAGSSVSGGRRRADAARGGVRGKCAGAS
jgi:hypothetical protein